MKSTFIAVALAASAAALPAVTLRAFENSCIISGSTERSCASTGWASEMSEFESRTLTIEHGAPTDPFESRALTWGFGDPFKDFRSDKPSGVTIILR